MAPVPLESVSPSRAAEPAFAAARLGQFLHLAESGVLHPLNHHLSDPHPARHLDRYVAQIHQQDLELSPIVAVDGGGCVGKRETVAKCETRSRPELAFKAIRDRNCNPRAEQSPFAGSQDKRFREGSFMERP